MVKALKFFFSLLVISVLTGGVLYGQVTLQIPRVYSPPLRIERSLKPEVALALDSLLSTAGYTMKGDSVADPIAIYGSGESTLATLLGYRAGTRRNLLANTVRSSQKGFRGYFTPEGGSVSAFIGQLRGSFSTAWNLSEDRGQLVLLIGSSIRQADIAISRWNNQTEFLTRDDIRARQFVPDDQALRDYASREGGFEDILAPLSQFGFGETAVTLAWNKEIPQQRQKRLKKVYTTVRGGLVIPTAEPVDTDHIVALDFGHDGAWGAICGANLLLELDPWLRIGADLQALVLAPVVHQVRVKTDRSQTELLLLEKRFVSESFGPEWNFYLYGTGGGFRSVALPLPLTWTAGYHFSKIADSTLYPQDNGLSFEIINSGQRAGRHELHELFGRLSVEAGGHVAVDVQVSVPVGGRGIMASQILSVGLRLGF